MEAVAEQLEAWGEGSSDERRPRRTPRSLDRDLGSVLTDLSTDYPLLATFVERTRGGQRQLPLGGPPSLRGLAPGTEPLAESRSAGDVAALDHHPGMGDEAGTAEPAADREPSGPEADRVDSASDGAGALPDPALPGAGKRKAPQRLGLRVRYGSWPDDPTLGRLVESTVWVNDAHPAYRRAAASRAEGYHVALTVAMALAALAVEPAEAQAFLSDFLARWGMSGRDTRGGQAGRA